MRHIKSIILAIAAVLIVCTMAIASDMVWTSTNNFHSMNQAPVQFFGSNNSRTKQTTVAHQWVDLSNAVLYAVWSASGTCFERTTAVNGTNGTAIATPIPNTTWHIRAVNPANPFANFSGCVGGFVKIE